MKFTAILALVATAQSAKLHQKSVHKNHLLAQILAHQDDGLKSTCSSNDECEHGNVCLTFKFPDDATVSHCGVKKECGRVHEFPDGNVSISCSD